MNVVVLRGYLSSAPVLRVLVSGSSLYSLEVTTATADGSVSVPVAWFDPPTPPTFEAGDEVVVHGVVRRRFFRVAAATQSRTEVVAAEVLAATDRRRVKRLLERLGESLGVDAGGAVRSG
jgi:single-strand DNA-binding protein